MDRARLPGDPPVEILLRRSARARRYALRVSALDGRVTLTLPARGSAAEALDFARAREGWIRRALAAQGTVTPVRIGAALPFEGRVLTVTPGRVRAPRAEGAALLVPPDPERAALRIATFLKSAARLRLAAAAGRHAATLGREVGRLTLRDTRSRWGSCTAGGDLMFSWRLVMAPPEVLDYVAAHEVAHFDELNHSPAFWAVVARLCPDYGRHRRWLRREGAALHRYRFGD
ncbi:MAG: M48 family metallopeptidase [Paracoccaceae bacterium]|nr:M48 family metallopeptidase [Paracoccaceae bacterium]